MLYPGNSIHEPFRSNFHEILPGLGAFSIRPGSGGSAKGIRVLSKFLDDVIDHLSNRTTAHERSRYHLGEALSLKKDAIPYGTKTLPEKDQFQKKITPNAGLSTHSLCEILVNLHFWIAGLSLCL